MKIIENHVKVLTSASTSHTDNVVSHVNRRYHISIDTQKTADQINFPRKETQTLQETIQSIILLITVVNTLSILIYQSAAGNSADNSDVDADNKSTNGQDLLQVEQPPVTNFLLGDTSEHIALMDEPNKSPTPTALFVQREDATPQRDQIADVTMTEPVDDKSPSENKTAHYARQQVEKPRFSMLLAKSERHRSVSAIRYIRDNVRSLNANIIRAKASPGTSTRSIRGFGNEITSPLLKRYTDQILCPGASCHVETQSSLLEYISPLLSAENNTSLRKTGDENALVVPRKSWIPSFVCYGILETSKKTQDKYWQTIYSARHTAINDRSKILLNTVVENINPSDESADTCTNSPTLSFYSELSRHGASSQPLYDSPSDKAVEIVSSMDESQRASINTVNKPPSLLNTPLVMEKSVVVLRQSIAIFIDYPKNLSIKNKKRGSFRFFHIKISLWLLILLLLLCFFHH